MTLLKISVPVYKKNEYDNFRKDGKIEVSSDVDNLSEGYQSLKLEIDKLLSEVDAENRLAKEVHALERELEHKAYKLKKILQDIERATEHYETLKSFLQNLGVDPVAMKLTFDKRFLPQESSLAEVKVISQSEF
ncbi:MULTISPECIES: hypothetical protein [unclassified Microcoleus]|uniref:hypothetical protein n=1 Tax=unclassified Microcoleus TaxID=2642155 RepID=UPI002FD5740F